MHQFALVSNDSLKTENLSRIQMPNYHGCVQYDQYYPATDSSSPRNRKNEFVFIRASLKKILLRWLIGRKGAGGGGKVACWFSLYCFSNLLRLVLSSQVGMASSHRTFNLSRVASRQWSSSRCNLLCGLVHYWTKFRVWLVEACGPIGSEFP